MNVWHYLKVSVSTQWNKVELCPTVKQIAQSRINWCVMFESDLDTFRLGQDSVRFYSICWVCLSSSAPPVRHRVQAEDHPAEFLLLRPVGAGQWCGGGPEQGEPLHLVQHRQPREHHHVPSQGETRWERLVSGCWFVLIKGSELAPGNGWEDDGTLF